MNMMVSTGKSRLGAASGRRPPAGRAGTGADAQQQQHAYISMLHILQGDVDPAEVNWSNWWTDEASVANCTYKHT